MSIESLEAKRKQVRTFILKIIMMVAAVDAILLMVLARSCYG